MPDWTSSPFYPTAVAAAQQYGVPTNLFVEQIGQESSFNPSASNGNAFGIAQFMPGTAQQYGVNRADPVSSLYGAAQYDAQLYSQYGSWQTAMQKYGTTAGGNAPGVAQIAAQADQGKSFFSDPLNYDFGPWLDNNVFNKIPFLGDLNKSLGSTSDPNSTLSKTASGISSLADILTDISRVVTVIVGLICLIVGLALLGSKPALQIVERAKGTAAKVAAIAA